MSQKNVIIAIKKPRPGASAHPKETFAKIHPNTTRLTFFHISLQHTEKERNKESVTT
jgi:hypothetical protein